MFHPDLVKRKGEGKATRYAQANLRRNRPGRSRSDRDIARFGGDPAEPGLDLRIGGEIEPAAFLRDMRLGLEGDVGEAQLIADEIVVGGEMLVHQLQRRIAGLLLGLDLAALDVLRAV